jgi:hypothetical protein
LHACYAGNYPDSCLSAQEIWQALYKEAYRETR